MDLQGEREELSTQKGKGKAAADQVSSSFPPYYQAARTRERTKTEIDFPVGLTPPPNLRYWKYKKYPQIDFDLYGTWEALDSSELIVFDVGVILDTSQPILRICFRHFFDAFPTPYPRCSLWGNPLPGAGGTGGGRLIYHVM